MHAYNGISTYNDFRCISPNPTRYEVTQVLQQANAIQRNISMLDYKYIPAIISIGTISSIAAAIFLGAPFFLIAGAITAGLVIIGLNQSAKCIEDIESITSYFKNRKPFKFPDGDADERIISDFNPDLGYRLFTLEQVKQKA